MKRALQGILIAGAEMMRTTKDSEKLITIREGHRDHTEGPVLIGCHILDWAHHTNITSVRHTTINELTEDELRDDSFDSKEHAVEVLSQWYPNINTDSDVTVIRWEAAKRQDEETVRLSKAKYDQLVERENILNALEAAGVDNWEGYEAAYV